MRSALTTPLLAALLFACGGDGSTDDTNGDTPVADTGGEVGPDECGGCPTGKLCCASRFDGDVPRCIDPDLNPENCGGCGTFCAGACMNGACVDAPECGEGGACPDALTCSSQGGGLGRCCPAGTTFIVSPADFFGCCPDGDICGCREGNCPISRLAAKTDVRYLAPDEVARIGDELLATRLATWRYRGAPERHLGFVIDDGAPAHAIAADGQHVDLYGYVSLAVAALQRQALELRSLDAEVRAMRAELDAMRAALEGRAPVCEDVGR